MIYGTEEFAALLKGVMVDGVRHDLYEETCAHAKAMSVHVYGNKPVYLLERARPREDAEVTKYRIENYEPTTKAGADKSLDIVSKIFNPSIYSIRWKDNNSQIEELKSYTMDYYPEYNSLVAFNKEVLLRRMIADPNGIVAVKPEMIPDNDATKIKPVVIVYGSEALWHYDDDHYLVFIKQAKESISVFTGDKIVDVFYFEYYDKNRYLSIKAYFESDTKDIVIEELEVYNHNHGEIPVWKLRGKSKSLENGMIVFESFFSSALPHWNLAIIHESDLLGAYINHMHPQKYELAEECAYQFPWNGQNYGCRNGLVKYPAKGNEYVSMDCPKCGGSGLTTVKSPYGAYQFTKQKLDDAGAGNLLPVGYVTIPVEATKMLEERTEKMVQRGMWAINMDVEDNVGENQSGIAKVIDRSAQYDTLYNISSVMFDIHTNNEFYFINKYMNAVEATASRKQENKNLPEVNKPVMFDISSVSELINNFSIAQKSGLDKNFLRVKQIEILSRDLSTNPDMKHYLIMLISLDPLYGFAQEEIDLAVTKGVVRKIDWAIHDNIKTFIDRAIKENPRFPELEKQEQIAVLENYGQELVDSQQPQITEDVFDTGGTSQQD